MSFAVTVSQAPCTLLCRESSRDRVYLLYLVRVFFFLMHFLFFFFFLRKQMWPALASWTSRHRYPELPCRLVSPSRPASTIISECSGLQRGQCVLCSSCKRLHKCGLTRSDSPVHLSLALTADRWTPLTHRRKAPRTALGRLPVRGLV